MEWYQWVWWSVATLAMLGLGYLVALLIWHRDDEKPDVDYWRKKYERLEIEFKKLDREMAFLVRVGCRNQFGEYYP